MFQAQNSSTRREHSTSSCIVATDAALTLFRHISTISTSESTARVTIKVFSVRKERSILAFCFFATTVDRDEDDDVDDRDEDDVNDSFLDFPDELSAVKSAVYEVYS